MAMSLKRKGSGEQRSGVLPPWLWFWLVVYIVGFPSVFDIIKRDLLVLLTGNDGVNLSLTYSWLERAPVAGEFLIDITLSVGVLAVFLPWIRTLFLRRKYELTELQFLSSEETLPETWQTLSAVSQFIKEYAPGVVLTFNNTGGRLLPERAFVYPIGFRRTGMAVSGRLLRLWETDRQAAEAILLHEIEHYRHGDKFVVGAGSFLETVVKYWFPLTIVVSIIPLVLLFLVELITEIQGEMAVRISLPTIISYQVQQFFVLDIPSIFLTFFQWLFKAASLFTGIVIAIWCAEINADRFVIDTTQSTQALAKAMEQHATSPSWWRWLRSGIHHPPPVLRQWLVRQSEGTRGLTLLLLFFPVAWLIRLVFLCGWALSFYLTFLYTGTSTGYIVGALGVDIESFLEAILPVWVVMAMVLALWPLLTRHWERLFVSTASRLANVSNRAYLLSSGVVALVCVISLVLSLLPAHAEPAGLNPTTPYSKANTPDGHFKIGDTATIGGLWKVTVQSVQVRSDNLGSLASANHEFLAVNVSLKNISKETNNLNDHEQFRLQDLQHVQYDDTYITVPPPPAVAQNGNVAAGATVQGPLTYVEVPVSISLFTLSFTTDWKNYNPSQVTVWNIIVPSNVTSAATTVPTPALTPTPTSTPTPIATQPSTIPTQPAVPTPTPTQPAVPTPTPAPTYPTLQASYTGTLVNTTYSPSTSASATMSSIVEDQTGGFAGTMTIHLPLVGSGVFTGTVSTNGSIQFTVIPTDGSGYAAIVFIGTVHADGSMSGTYTLPGTNPLQRGTWQFSPG